MNFYKRHIGDYIKKAGHLTLLEHGVYSRLMDVYYTREAGIPEDKAARLIGARGKDELQALNNVLDEFFTLIDGLWKQNRCEEEIEVANQQAEANRNNGKKGGRPKRIVTDQQPTQNPLGFISDNENNLSQTPDSRLQKKTDDDDSTDGGSALSSSDGIDLPPADGFAGAAAAPLPMREVPPVSEDPAVILSVALRRQGVNCMSTHPVLQDWASKGVTLAVLTEAISLARETKGNDPIHPNYLAPIVTKLLNPPPASPQGAAAPRPPAAPRKPQGMDPKGLDESYDDYNARISKAEAERRKAQA